MNTLHPRMAAIGRWPLLVICLIGFSSPALAAGLSLNQCANGGISDSVDHLECYDGWINSNLIPGKAAASDFNWPGRTWVTASYSVTSVSSIP